MATAGKVEVDSVLEAAKNYLVLQSQLSGGDFYIPQNVHKLLMSLDEPPIISLREIERSASACKKCRLSTTRKHVVFGAGNEQADVMLIGEAPGYEEDQQGAPFVGAAGKLLDKILQAIQFERKQVYITNVLKCRPPDNRDPMPDEIQMCDFYLQSQLKQIQPRIILALGRFAGQALLKTQAPLNQIRGKVHQYLASKLIVTYHPAALLRHAEWKRPTWEDVKLLRKVYDEL
ncbi:uracil-DNA glycosylase [candidate division KSB1 bacterium]|nr:uracil-DNA glycosylase [candidate division KSB1 bacterium]